MIPTGASVRPLPRRKGPRGVRQVEVSPGRWMDEAVAVAQGIPLTFPLPTMGAGPVTRRHEAPDAEAPAPSASEAGAVSAIADHSGPVIGPGGRPRGAAAVAVLVRPIDPPVEADGAATTSYRAGDGPPQRGAAGATRDRPGQTVYQPSPVADPEVPPMPGPAPAAPAKPTGRPPSPAQEQAYRAVTERGLYWPDVARELGSTSWSVKNMIQAYMRRNGIPGEPPGRTPKEETSRRTMLAKGMTPSSPSRANDSLAPAKAFVEDPSESKAMGDAAVADRLVLAPEGHPWAADPQPIDVSERGADHAETIPVAETIHAAGGEPEPVASPAKGTPAPHHPAPQLLEDLPSSDQPPVDAAAAVARLARELDEMEMARDELRELLVDAADAVVASDPRTRYVESLLAAAPAEYIRDRIERALGIEADRDAWADGYRRALRDVLDVVRTTRGTTYPQADIIERVARLAIDPPAA